MSWLIQFDGQAAHVMPTDDERKHLPTYKCWCEPTPEIYDGLVWVHHSLDQREAFERGERLPS